MSSRDVWKEAISYSIHWRRKVKKEALARAHTWRCLVSKGRVHWTQKLPSEENQSRSLLCRARGQTKLGTLGKKTRLVKEGQRSEEPEPLSRVQGKPNNSRSQAEILRRHSEEPGREKRERRLWARQILFLRQDSGIFKEKENVEPGFQMSHFYLHSEQLCIKLIQRKVSKALKLESGECEASIQFTTD